MIKKSVYNILFLLAIYVLILFRWGYEFGRNDQMQVLAYAKYINNPALYQNDQYIQGLSRNFPNERYFFSFLLSVFVNHLEGICFVLHILTSLLLLLGLYKISVLFITNDLLRWLALLVLFVPLYGINLGGNELYYNSFFVSNVVKTIGIWGILFAMKQKYYTSFLMFSFVVFLQPVVGTQLFVTISAILLVGIFTRKINISKAKFIYLNLIFICTAGVWMILLQRNFEGDHSVSDRLFFNILFVFRAPHHYLPSAFPLKYYLVLLPLFLLSSIYFFRKNDIIFLFFCISFIGLIVYTIGVQCFHSNSVAALQWFKVTIWLKAFSVIALFAVIDKKIHFYKTLLWTQLFTIGLFSLSAICLVLMCVIPEKIPFKVNRDFGAQYANDPAVDIALKAKQNISEDAVFVHPFRFTELKYYGERSSFVEYRILSHTKKEILHWHTKLIKLYNVGWGVSELCENVDRRAEKYFCSLKEKDFIDLFHEGATHIITYKSINLNFPLIVENSKYRIYKITDSVF